jgi:GNAT superfamily N-acetyltransferase
MDPERRYFFPVTGYNFRLTNVAAAMLCAQMERRDQILARRNEIFAEYKKQLEDIPGISFPPVAEWAEVAPWMFAIQVNAPEFGLSRDGLMRYLKEQGIDTRPMFIPLHTLPMFREGSRQRGEHLPVTEEIAASSIMLPTYNGLTTAELMQVTDSIKKSALERGVRYRRGHSRPLKKVLGSSTFGVPTRPFRHELQLSGDLFNRLLALPEGNREEEAMSSQGQGYTRRPREEGCQVGELTITAVTQGDRKQLGAFFTVLNNDKETATFFHPHPFTSAYADTLCQQAPTRKDRYYLARFRGEVVGYAMLRGWDEGFAVPSFGVCVHPEVRNAGIGRLLLWHALKESKRAGVSSVRLTVYRCNHRAVHVYAQYGFQFKDKDEHSLVGIVDLSEVPEEGPPLIKEVVLGEWLRAQAA